MTNEQAKQGIRELSLLLNIAHSAIEQSDNYKAEKEKLQNQLSAERQHSIHLKHEKETLQRTLNRANKILSHYQHSLPDELKIDICPNCNGEGGFIWETEEGYDGEPCQLCDQTGIVSKEVADKIANIEQEPSVPTENTEENSNDLPF